MKTAISVLRTLHARKNRLIFVELPFCNGHIDLDDILPHDAACPDVEMADVDQS
jgi:hypothetical protein